MPICASCGRESEGEFAFCPNCGAELLVAPSAGEQRKTVTVLFCDVTGSTALGESTDPEAVRALLARYFERMKGIVEAHGGTVEKFIGDAVMAVFGVPQVHEDDALRGVRAACEMRDALPGLGVQARIGLNTGEVVTGTEERLATGDAVNVAARLEQATQPGEILMGEKTLTLVRDAVEAEAVEPLELKGKAEPVPAFRLVSVYEAPERRHESPFVGRVGELETLQQAWHRVCAGRRCELLTVVGEAGVGKSRLTAEFLSSVEARSVGGRCLPYGEGITYWPVVEVIRQLDALPSDPAAAASLRSLLGESDEGTSAEEIAWAFRKLLEEQAPLICLFDDMQWGEETFLELVEHVALLSAGAPILLLCLARLDLVERRAEWPVALRLGPLADSNVDELIPELLTGDVRRRIARASGGNPLFVTEMVAMASQTEGEIAVPPNLHALLAARLDQLESEERSVLERGAVEGEVFHRGAVQALSDSGQVTPRLAALVRKQLIRPDRARLPGDDAFRFRHLLIRDAAYDALPKSKRAELHERFAAWREEHGRKLVELDEILGYHLEQAASYRTELGAEVAPELAAAARRRLGSAGSRARARIDMGAAVKLLERAAALLLEGEIDLALEHDLLEALWWSGRGEETLDRAAALATRASAAGDRIAELCALLEAGQYRISLEPEGATDVLETLVGQALPVFEAAGDDFALHVAYRALGQVADTRAHADAGLAAFEQAVLHARRAGLRDEYLFARAQFRLFGTTPLSELLAWLQERGEQVQHNPGLRSAWARALARLGRAREARAMLGRVREELEERGARLSLAGALAQDTVEVELLAGDPEAAVEAGERGCRLLEELGERGFFSGAAGRLARACVAAGRLEEADAWATRAAELGASDDALTQMLWRQARALVLARRGESDSAEELAEGAVAIADGTDFLDNQGDAYFDLADVLVLGGKSEQAARAYERALERYERKENLAMVAQVRPKLEELRKAAPA